MTLYRVDSLDKMGEDQELLGATRTRVFRPESFYEPCIFGECGESAFPCSRKMSLVMIATVAAIIIGNIVMFVGYHTVGVAALIVFHIFLALLLTSWIQTCITHPGSVPIEWSSRVKALNDSGEKLPYSLCVKAGRYKPPRSHFDKVSKRLVLNMDHYCPWVCNTVGFYNKKFFILFLLYTWVTTAFVVLTSIPRITDCLDELTTSAIMVLCCLALDACLALALFMFWCNHMYFVLINTTTVEQQFAHPETCYDCGWFSNMGQVFGTSPWLWLIPVFGDGPEGDGVTWPLTNGKMCGQLPCQTDQDEHIV